MTELFRRLRYLLNRSRFDQELADDLEFHREMAARTGGARLGDAVRLREDARAAWGWTWIDRLGQDLRYAARMLWRSPGFTLTAVVMLGIGIGANVAAFGFLNLIVLRPLPVRDPDTLLRFERRAPEQYATDLPYAEMAFVRTHATTLSAVLASHGTRLTLQGADKPISVHFVTANFFEELGTQPRLGRALDPHRDDRPDAEPIVVLSHDFWQRQFGANPGVIGTTVYLNGKPATVAGVAAADFSGLSLGGTDLWTTLGAQPYFVDGSQLLTSLSADVGVKMWGRMRPGTTPAIVEQELRSLVATLRTEHPNDIWEHETLASAPGGYAKIGGGSHRGSGTPGQDETLPVIGIVGALVLLILAVACANLGGLLLARGVARERELTIRAAVGAGRARLLRQLFTESLLLAFLGSAAGMALAFLLLRTVMLATGAPPWLDPTPDWRVFAFALGIGVAAAMVFGLAPAWQVVRQRHRASLLRQGLIGAQVAASCVLLIVAGLLVRALDRATSATPGFDHEQLIAVDPGLAEHGYSTGSAQVYLDALQARLGALPGVESVALATTPPLGGRRSVYRQPQSARRPVDIYINRVTPPFFSTLKIPILRGRNLQPGDSHGIVVSESFALGQWPGEDPVGQQFEGNTVVGIAGNARWVALQDPDAVEMYHLVSADDLPSLVAMVRTSGSPESVTPLVAAAAKVIDPKIFPDVRLVKTSYAGKLRETEITALSVAILGFSALLLACLGLVGLVAYSVSQRTKEIGIRMALGARGSHVLSVVLRQLSRPVALGLLLGIAGAAALSQVMRRELYGVSHLDPLAYGAAIGLFVVTAALTALVPARRALRVDPLKALRYE